MAGMVRLSEEEAEQLLSDSLVLEELIGSGLVDSDTAAQVQLSINPEPWWREHPVIDGDRLRRIAEHLRGLGAVVDELAGLLGEEQHG